MLVKLFNKTFGTCWHGTSYLIFFPQPSFQSLCNQSTPMVSGCLQHQAAPISALMASRCWCNETDLICSLRYLAKRLPPIWQPAYKCCFVLSDTQKLLKIQSHPVFEIHINFANGWLEDYLYTIIYCLDLGWIVFPGVRCSMKDRFQILRPVSCNSWGMGDQ